MEKIKQLIAAGQTDEAIRQLDAYITTHATADNAFYLRGNAYRKQGNMRQHASCLQSNDITTVCMVMLAPSNPHFKRIFSVICRRFHKFRDHEDKMRNKCRIWIWDSLL